MTPTEFDEWRADYKRRFPSIVGWFHRHDSDLQLGILQTWQECLECVELRDALAVNKAMSTGQLEPVGSFKEDQTALTIRSYALRLAGERRKLMERDKASYAREETGRPVTKTAPLAIMMKISAAARIEICRQYPRWQENEYHKAQIDEKVRNIMQGYWDLEAEHDSNATIRAAVIAKAEEDGIAWQGVALVKGVGEDATGDETTAEQIRHVLDTMEGKK